MKAQTEAPFDQPWLRNRRWASGRIRDRSNVFIFSSVILSLVLNAISWSAAVAAWRDRARSLDLFIFTCILFVTPSLALLAWTIRQIMVRLKFGRSVFELETLPGAVGGWLAGTIRAPVAFDAPKGIRLELECVARVTTRDFTNKASTHEDILLVGKQSLGRSLPREGGRTCIPIAFQIPPDAKPTGDDGVTPVFWRLRARAPQRGADYDATFIVPVFRVPDASNAVPKAEGLAAPLRKTQSALAPQD
ncbi:MAG TPA: hypothetical protein VMU04_00655 [Candidatus Acidoferrum sp.]|nr:hypothetical protein [Candidatus Acidoferrum sp.]